MILRLRAALAATALAVVLVPAASLCAGASETTAPVLLAQQAPSGTTVGTPGGTSGGTQAPQSELQKLKAYCEKHETECKVRAEMIKEWCKSHPDECKVKIAELKAWCSKHPDQCRG